MDRPEEVSQAWYEDSADYLDERERECLRAALERSLQQAEEGKLIDADLLMAKLRALP